MKNSLWCIISVISLLVMTGCSSDSIVYRHLAEVDTIDVRLLDGERNLEIAASGSHRNGCRRLDGYDVTTQEASEQQRGSIVVQLWEWRPDSAANVACVLIAPPFNIVIPVDVSMLAPGQYEIDVNSVSANITLSDN